MSSAHLRKPTKQKNKTRIRSVRGEVNKKEPAPGGRLSHLSGELLPDRVLLRGGKLLFERRRQVLHPTVIYHRYRQQALAPHAIIPDDKIVSGSCGQGLEQNAPGNLGVCQVAAAVRVRIHDIKHVGELSADIGVVPATLLGAPLHAVAASVT